MKMIIICLSAVLLLAACNNKTENQDNNTTVGEENVRSEMPIARPGDKGQNEWTMQTTIMSSKPMVIDFFADWCPPCKKLSPILDEIEKKYKGEVIFRRIDIDQDAKTALEFNVQSIPTLMFVTPKGEYQTIVGLEESQVIEAKIAELLKRSSK